MKILISIPVVDVCLRISRQLLQLITFETLEKKYLRDYMDGLNRAFIHDVRRLDTSITGQDNERQFVHIEGR